MAAIDKNSSDVRRLLKYFFPIAWIGHVSLGLNYGIMGPARPYLARFKDFKFLSNIEGKRLRKKSSSFLKLKGYL